MQTVAAFLCCAALLGVAHSQVDLTLVPEANGTVVVQACLAKITGANIFAADNQMLRRIAYVETRDGTDSDTYTPTNNGGIWQLSESKYMQTKGSSLVLTAPVSSISSSFGITWSTTQWVDLRKPLYSALAARLYLLLISTSIPLATNINGQASYWVNQYTFSAGTTSDFTTAVTALQAIEECSVNGLDLFFVLDESGSVGYSNYQLMKTFAYNIANSFTIGPDDVQIGLLSYSSSHSFRFYLNTHSTKSAVLTAINNIPYNSGGTYTAGALNALRLNGFTSSVGARPSSQGIPRVAIVVTDGYSNSFSQTVAAANALHTAGIIGFAIGISGANTAELNAIASEPSYVAFISSFNSALLANLQQTISNEACTASPEFEVTEMVSSMVGQGQSQYVQYNVPPGNMGITIQLNVSNNGTAVLYASNVVQTPNEALHDIKIVTSGYGDAFVNISALNPLGSQDKVFVAIEGVSGNSTIQVSAEVGDTSTEPVMVTPLASDIARNFGQSLVVSCNVTGKPSPQVNWYKDGVMLTSSSSVQIQTMNINGNNLTKLSTLTISSVADIHEGMYTCTGTNMLPNGAVTHSSSFTLDVTGYVSINFVGQVHTFSSISLDWDLPPVTGLAAQVDHYLVNIDELETSKNWTFFAVQSHATILSLHPYFTYICRVAIVTNLTHPYTSTISLRTLQEPPTGPPLNPNSSATTSQTVNMTWSPPALEHQNGIIQYYLVNVTEIETGTLTAYNITSAWLFLTGLHPHYNYLFVFAAATIGLGPTGSSITITTTEDAPTAAPLSLSVSIVNPTTVSVSWNPPPLEFRNGIIRNYTIRYYESQTNTFYTAISQNTPAVISSLHAYYNYSFSVAAFTVLTGPFSSSVNLQTPQTVPQGSPGNFTANVSSPYSAVLSWDPLPSDQQNGVVTGYVINVTVIETGQTFLLFSATTSLTVNSLNPFRTFVCIIAAQTSAGIGPFGPIFTVVTPQDAPAAAPATTTSSGVSSRSFAINWSPPLYKFQNGVITHYVIRVTEIETGTVTQYMSTSTSYSLQSLHPAYTYQYEIAASTSVGLGPFSSPISIITDEEIPGGPPAAINGVSSKPTALTLVWTPPPPSDRNGIIVSYLINVTLLTTGEVVQYTSTNTSIVINGLKPFTTYTCIIAASTAVGLGPFTQVFTITTDEDSPNTAPVITTSFSVDSSTVALQWTPPPVEDHNGIIRKYLINATAIQTGEYTITETTTTTGIVVSLVPSFTYLFSVSAYTVSAGPYTPTITITLPEDVPSGFPRDLAGSSTTPYSIYLSWNPPPLNEQSGQIIEYIINVTHAGTLNTVQYTATTTNINITNLEPYTTYICVVAAGTAIGTGPFSHLFFLRTLEAVPSASPEHATGVSGGPNTIHVAWDPPSIDEQNGEIDGYRINVTEAETNNVFQLITNQTQITINNLHPFYTYHCYITAITVGEGPYTDAVTIVTDEAAPSAPPQSVSESVQSSTGVFIQWSPPQTSDTNGIIRSYTVILVNTRTGTVASYSATNTNINITNLSPHTEYRYNVSATTVSAGPFTATISFTTLQDVPSGPPEQLNVSTTSSSTLQLQWNPPSLSSVNGIVQHYIITVYELATDTIFESTTSTSTQLSVSGLHPYYIYTCSISAVTIGSGPVMNITIQMPEDVPASVPVNIEPSTVTSTMVEISWDPLPSEDENGIVRHYLINVTEIQTGNTFQTTSSDESAMLSNLHPAYEYTFRIAVYTIGSGPYSTVFTITTLEDVPSSAPIGLSSTVQGSTSVLLSWSPPPAADQNGVITVYTVEVINTVTSNKDVYMTSSSTLTVVSLDPYTTYECIVAANTSVGMGPFSAKLAFQTVEAVPTAPPEDVSVEAPSSTSLDIEWSAPPQDSQNGVIRSYIVRVYEVITSTTLTYNTTEESLTVGFLHPHYQYQVSVAAVTVGQGPFSDATTIQTPQDAPSSPPAAITVSSISSTSLSISWSPPLPAQVNGIIQYYIVNVSVAESQQKLQFETSSMSLTLNDLHPFYSHTVIVAAVTVAPGPFSNEFVQKLPPDAPSGPPQSISVSVVSSTSLQLSWSPPLSVHQNGLIQSYTILVFEQQTNTTIEKHQNFLQTTIILNNLQPNYDYTLSVAAHTVALGPYGSVIIRTSEDAPTGPPQNLSTLITSSRSITLQWNPPRPDLQNGVIQHYTVQLVDSQTNQVLQYTSTQHSITISNLHPYYTYTCTVTAVTVASGPAALVTFQLPQDVPTGPPLNVSTLALNATSLFVTWKPPQNDLQNGIITSYSVQLFEVETSSTQIINSVTGLSVTVGALHPNYMYRVQVAAVTTGLGPYSNISAVQLPVSSPSGSPTGVSGASTSPYSITIAWTAPEPGLLNGAVTGYIINVTHSDTLVTVQYNSITTSLVINNLEPFTTYICVVAAETAAGNGPFSHLILIQTQETAPSGAPEHASGIPVGSTSIHLTWDPPSAQYQNGLIREYLVNISEPVSGYINQTSTDQTQITINNLVPHRTYTCYVAAVTVAVGPYTGAIMVATEIDVPGGPPLNLSSNVNSSSTATVQWRPPQADLQNGIIQFYSIQLVAAETGSMLEYTSTELSLTITDLHPHYTYTCTIAAVTVAPGPVETIVFQMLEDLPTGSPLNVTTTSVNATALLVTWVAPSADLQNGIIIQYRINLTESETGVITYFTVLNILQTTLTDLHPYYNYQVTVAAITIGLGPYSTEATVQLPEAEPSVSPNNFISEVTTTPSAYLTWSPLTVDQYNGQFGGYRLTCSSQGSQTITVQASGTSITLADLENNDHYTCTVCAFTSVGCGPSSVTYFSTFRDSPVGPPTAAVANVTAISALVNWVPPFDPENLIISYVITYRLISTSLSLETPRPPVTTANIVGTSFTLQPLLESSVYRIVVYAVTLNGTSPGSQEIEVRTGKPDSFAPIDFQCVPTSYSILLCSWQPPMIAGFQVVGYRLSYKLADGFDYYPGYGTVMETTLASNIQQYAIDSLQPYGGYLVVLEANITTVPEMPGSGSGDVVITPELPTSPPEYTIRETSTVNITLADIPTATVRSLSVDVTSPTSIQLSWLPPERVHWKGLINHFVVSATRLGPVEGGVTKRQQPSTLTAEVQPQNNHRDPSLATEPLQMETYVMQGLEEYYDYSIVVHQVNAAGSGPTHPPVLQSMPAAAPSGPPIEIGATATSSALTVTWSPPSPLEANGPIIGYTLQLTRVRFGGRTETNALSGTTLSFTINGLTPYEPIAVTVAARTDQGLGPFSINNTFYTSEAPSSPPQNIRTTTVDETSVTVFWTEPKSKNGLLRGYQVIYTVHSNDDQTSDRGTKTQYTRTVGNDTFSARFTDLQPGIYDFKVRARNGAGYGDNSSSELVILQSTATEPTRPPTVDAVGGISTVVVIPIVVVVVVLIIVVLLGVLVIVCVITRRSHTRKKLDIAGNNGDSLELPVYDPAPVSQNIEMTRAPTAVVENPYVGWELKSTSMTTDMDDLKSQPLEDAPPAVDLPSYAEVRRTHAEPSVGEESGEEEQAGQVEQAEQAEPGMEEKVEEKMEEKKKDKVGEELVVANQAADEEEEEAELTDL